MSKNTNRKSFCNVITTNSNHMVTSLLENTDLCKFSLNFKNKEYEALKIKAIDIVDCSDDIYVGYVTRKGEGLSKEATNFIEILKNEISK